MSTIDIGDTVIILGGRNKGLRAIVVDKTAKMFYLTLVPDQRVIRVMQYNVGLIDEPAAVGKNIRVKQQQHEVLRLQITKELILLTERIDTLTQILKNLTVTLYIGKWVKLVAPLPIPLTRLLTIIHFVLLLQVILFDINS